MSLSPEAARLIAEARSVEDPSAADRARLRAKLDASWAAAEGSVPHPADHGLPAASRAVSAKLVAGGVCALVLGSLGAWHLQSAMLAETRQTRVPAAQPLAAAEPAPATPASGPPSAADRADPSAAQMPVRAAASAEPRASEAGPRSARKLEPNARPRREHRRQVPSRAPAAVPVSERAAAPHLQPPQPAAPAVPVDGTPARAAHVAATGESTRERLVETSSDEFAAEPIADELALLGAAHEALQRGRPSEALRLIQQHGFRFPRGALAQERLVVHALALCAQQRRTAARQVLSDLERRAGTAPVVARIRRDCGF